MLGTLLIFFTSTITFNIVICTDAVFYESHSYSASSSYSSSNYSDFKCGVKNETGTSTSTTIRPPTVTTSPMEVNTDNALEKIWQGNAAFTLNFLNLKTIENSGESFIASPFSVLLPMAQLALYANGTSFEQLVNILNVNNTAEIRQGFKRLLDNFKVQKNITLSLSQRVYGNKQFEFTYNFKKDTGEYFGAEAQNLDFSQSKKAAEIINNWVKNQTNGLIANLIDENMLSTLTRLILVNAIYFKGNWLRPFNPKKTQQKEFYVTKDNKKIVNMMFQDGRFRYIEDAPLQIKALELFYKDSDYSFLCILPTSNDTYSLEGLAQQLQDPEVFKQLVDSLIYENVQVFLPSLQTSTTTDLSTILKEVNVTQVFNYENSGISGILEKPEPLYISKAIQKAVIIINEVGSEAAAANAIVVGTTAVSSIPPKIFDANRPYFYFILYKKNILFCGMYTGS